MRTSPAGIEAIKRFEGCVLSTYRCAAGVCTIGYGHTGPDVSEGMTWTAARADAALVLDLQRFEKAVHDAVDEPMTQGQFDAMVSLAFNIGTDAFARSTLVKRFNAGDTLGAAAQFVVWHNVAGKLNPALLDRRARELWMFARASG
jgi:lysozyme